MKTAVHIPGFYIEEEGWGQPIFLRSADEVAIFYPEKVLDVEDLGDAWPELPPHDSPMYVGDIVRPSWN